MKKLKIVLILTIMFGIFSCNQNNDLQIKKISDINQEKNVKTKENSISKSNLEKQIKQNEKYINDEKNILIEKEGNIIENNKQKDSIKQEDSSIQKDFKLQENLEEEKQLKIIEIKEQEQKREQEIQKQRNIKLEKDRKRVENIFSYYKNTSLITKSKLNCSELYVINDKMNEQEKEFGNQVIHKCIRIKEDAIKKLQENKKNISINDCDKIITEKFETRKIDKSSDSGKYFETRKTEIKNREIEFCKLSFALRNNCENIDSNLKEKCIKLSDFRDTMFYFENIKNFDIGNYLD